MTEHEIDEPGSTPVVAQSTTSDGPGRVPPRASIRRNVAHMASAQAVTWALALSMAVVVPRYLGPESSGIVQVAASLWTIAAILSFGTTTYLQLEIARRPQEGLSLVGTVLTIRTVALLIASVGLAVYAYLVEDGRTFVVVMAITGVSTLLAIWSEVYNAAFIGLERMATPAVTSVVAKALTAAGILLVVLVDGGIYWILGAGVLASFVGLGLLIRRFRAVGRVRFDGWRGNLIAVLVASIPFATLHIANSVYRQVDVIVISNVAGSRDVGWYAAADVIIGSLLFPATIVLASVFPTFGRAHATDPNALPELVQRTMSLLLLVAVPVGLGTALIGPTFAPLLLGDDYAGTGEILVVMGPVLILAFATTLLSQVALVVSRGAFWAIMLFAAAALTIPLDLVLVPWASDRFDNGGIGGAIAFVVTEVLQVVIGIAVVAPYLASRRNLWRTARVFAAGAAMCAAAWPLRQELFILPAAVGAVVYGIAVLALRVLDDYERSTLGSLFAKLGIRTPWGPTGD